MGFKDTLLQDMRDTFLNVDDFGEQVTLVRSGVEYPLNALYDELPLGEDVGSGPDAISHNPRLIVSSADLPGGKPQKNDLFKIGKTEFHGAKNLFAKDFEFPKDGSVIYYLKNK